MTIKRIFFITSIIVSIMAFYIVFIQIFGPGHFIKPPRNLHTAREVADFLASFGTWTVVASIIMMILQTMFTPVPLFLVAGANGYLFGIAWGIVITLLGAILGATVAFYLARFLARDYISRKLGDYYRHVQEMNESTGLKMLFLARLVPIIPSSIISYAAGLSKMSFLSFFLASIFGKLPEIVIYCALGHSLDKAESLAGKITLALVILTLILFSLGSRKSSKSRKPLFNSKAKSCKSYPGSAEKDGNKTTNSANN